MRVTLALDTGTEIEVNGTAYRVSYPAITVAAGDPDTTPFALVILTHAKPPVQPSQAAGPQTSVRRLLGNVPEVELTNLHSGLTAQAPSSPELLATNYIAAINAKDGRFLINETVDDAASTAPINLILNWRPKSK